MATADEQVPRPSVDQAFLDEQGITGKVVNVQTDAKGAKFFLYENGKWVLEPPVDPNQASTASYGAGGCAGTFVQIYRNGFDQLYWGGQSVCASSGTVFTHSLKIQLRKGCTGFFCGQQTRATAISPDSPYNAIQTINRFDKCSSAAQYRYDMVAYETVRSVQYGPFVDDENFVVGCNY
ncbi:hypothetical protein [Rathayibacter tritici]|uniref:hypothetical protein n=1 Tax=Rathayibacter tritici TaxID=33888 RepID=UPI0011B070E4|nr:hypothetical protein [Rathayibacter tritici]